MDRFLPNYHDPIVSILLLLGIIFIVAVLSYVYSLYRQEKKQKELLSFIKNFDLQECLLDTKNMPYDASMKKPLFLLATAYLNSGEYSKSINIYLYLLRHSKDDSLLLFLGKAYLKAGFLKRALEVFLEIVAKRPRDKEALYKIEYIYEKLGKLKEAKEVIEVLQAQGEDVEKLKTHLALLEAKFLPNKEAILEELLKKSSLRWPILREFFLINPQKAFTYYKNEDFFYLMDLFYHNHIEYEAINDENLKTLFFLKNQSKAFKKSDIFELELLALAKSAKKDFNATLEFIYVCTHCKRQFPIFFSRCLNCNRVYKLQIKVQIAREEKRSNDLL